MIANRDGGGDQEPAEWAASPGAGYVMPIFRLMAWSRCSTDPPTGSFRGSTTTATGSASSKATRSSSRNTSSCWPSSAGEPTPVCVKACRYIRDHQLPDGGWAIYPGGPAEVSASVKAYFALKLVGVVARRPGDGPRPRGDPRGWAARRRATASRGSTSRCWARSATTSARACRPSSCCIPSRLGFSLARCRPGRGRSSCRCRSCRHSSRCGGLPRSRGSPSCSATTCPRPRGEPGAGLAGRTSSWASTGVLKWADRWLPALVAAAGRSGRRIAGCSSTSRTPTAWGRSSRR